MMCSIPCELFIIHKHVCKCFYISVDGGKNSHCKTRKGREIFFMYIDVYELLYVTITSTRENPVSLSSITISLI